MRQHWRQQERDYRHQFEHNVERWSRGVFHRVASGISHDSSFMGIRTFPSEVACLNEFFGVIPGSTSIVDSHCDDKTNGEGAEQKAAQSVFAQ